MDDRKRGLCGAALLLACLAQAAEPPVGLEWSARFSLPARENGGAPVGVAAPFCGEYKGVALLAGGFSCPDEPQIKGGKRRICSEIYALPAGGTNWMRAGHLSQPLAEGLSATTPRGVVCVGGAADGAIARRAFLLTWDATRARAVESALPDFPCGVRLGSAAARDGRVYVAGGEYTSALPSDVWVLDLNAQLKGWQPLTAMPGPQGRMRAVAFVQNGDQKKTLLYVFGGCAKNAEGLIQSLTDGYAYDLAQPEASGRWQPVAPARPKGSGAPAWPLIGAGCVTSGDQHALVFGGLDAAHFDESQRTMAARAEEPREARLIADPARTPTGWNRQVLAYHTVTDRWFALGEVPFAPTVAGAVVKRADGSVLLAAGEVQPGLPVPECVAGTFVSHKRFHPLNWVVMGVYFCGLAGMGWWFMRKKKSANDYFKGGGRIPWWAAGISIFAAMFSSISFLAVPALAYMSDWRYWPRGLPFLLIPPLVIGFYLPLFRKLNLTCAYEYLELRFNLACRLFASLAFNIFMVARVAVVTYLPALAVAAATGADVNACIVVVSLLTIVYCAFGGIEAVIWSDVVQCVVLFGGALLVLALLIAGTDGGLAGGLAEAGRAGKLKLIDFSCDFSRPVVWVVLISGFVEYFISYTSDQCVIQRYMTTKDTRAAGRGIWLTVPLAIVASVVFFGIGTALYTFYRSQPEKLAVSMPKADSILPVFIANGLPVGLSGLVLAGLFAATITTLAANLNSSATAITNDFFVRLRKGMTDGRQIKTAQLFTFLVGLAGMAGALVLANTDIRSAFDQFVKLIGMLTSGLACLFMLGIFTRRVGATAALAGLALNYVVCLGLDQAALAWKPHLLLYGAIGIMTCLVTALAVSAVFPNRKPGLEGLIWSREEKRETGC